MVCSQCGANAAYTNVSGVTCTICGECGIMYIAETNMFVQLNLKNLHTVTHFQRPFIAVMLAMEALYKNWEIIAPHI